MHPLNASISFLGLCTFSGLRLRVLPGGKFGLIQSFWGILTHSCLSVGFLKSFVALCMCVHASGYPFGFWAFLTHPHTVLHKVVLGKFDFILCAAILRYSDALHCVCNPLCGCAPVQYILWTFKSLWLAHIAVCIPMHDGPSTHVHAHLHPSCPNMVQCQCDQFHCFWHYSKLTRYSSHSLHLHITCHSKVKSCPVWPKFDVAGQVGWDDHAGDDRIKLYSCYFVQYTMSCTKKLSFRTWVSLSSLQPKYLQMKFGHGL